MKYAKQLLVAAALHGSKLLRYSDTQILRYISSFIRWQCICLKIVSRFLYFRVCFCLLFVSALLSFFVLFFFLYLKHKLLLSVSVSCFALVKAAVTSPAVVVLVVLAMLRSLHSIPLE